LEFLTREYYRLRFGGAGDASADDHLRVRRALQNLKKAK
jgi:hypothetical protein